MTIANFFHFLPKIGKIIVCELCTLNAQHKGKEWKTENGNRVWCLVCVLAHHHHLVILATLSMEVHAQVPQIELVRARAHAQTHHKSLRSAKHRDSATITESERTNATEL